MNLELVIRKYALQNAVQHNGSANPKAVQGKVLAEQPEMRTRVVEILPLIAQITGLVNGMSVENQRKELEGIDATMLNKKEKVERIHVLPGPSRRQRGKVVMRFAPGRPVRCTWGTPGSPSSTTSTASGTMASSSTGWRTPTRTRSTLTPTR